MGSLTQKGRHRRCYVQMSYVRLRLPRLPFKLIMSYLRCDVRPLMCTIHTLVTVISLHHHTYILATANTNSPQTGMLSSSTRLTGRCLNLWTRNPSSNLFSAPPRTSTSSFQSIETCDLPIQLQICHHQRSTPTELSSCSREPHGDNLFVSAWYTENWFICWILSTTKSKFVVQREGPIQVAHI
jgi:hypothetical protein